MADFYPAPPGAKGLTSATMSTSADAADAIAPCVKYLQRVALRALAALGSATVLECVAITDFPRESLQPRYSEMLALGWIEPTGARKRNPSGKTAAVLTVTEKGRVRLAGGAA